MGAGRRFVWAGYAAFAWGLIFAAISFYWGAGGKVRASELLGLRQDWLDPGRRTIKVITKGSRVLEEVPASIDAFVWLALVAWASQTGRLSPEYLLWWLVKTIDPQQKVEFLKRTMVPTNRINVPIVATNVGGWWFQVTRRLRWLTSSMIAASGQLGSVARDQTPQRDIPSSQCLHSLEPFQESLNGRRSLKTLRGSKSVAMWLRSIGLVVSPVRRWRPVRMCSEPGMFCWAALT
jgi:hypothetical protein